MQNSSVSKSKSHDKHEQRYAQDGGRDPISSFGCWMSARDACAFSTCAMILFSSALLSLTVERINVELAAQGR